MLKPGSTCDYTSAHATQQQTHEVPGDALQPSHLIARISPGADQGEVVEFLCIEQVLFALPARDAMVIFILAGEDSVAAAAALIASISAHRCNLSVVLVCFQAAAR